METSVFFLAGNRKRIHFVRPTQEFCGSKAPEQYSCDTFLN
jgi:hypothetical protein